MHPASLPSRRALRIRGTVQGVGFRPALYRLARELGVGGFVRNESGAVAVEIEGAAAVLEAFVASLPGAVPPGARVACVESAPLEPLGESVFRIEESRSLGGGTGGAAELPADRGPCDACLQELEDPADRRFGYPFINCTTCGPRYTIALALPWDRARTTMDHFPLCAACRAEYEDPGARRFHAEPIACAACGPALSFWSGGAVRAHGGEALSSCVALLRAGGIVALKGAGGYLLACDAANEGAVALLRERKRRPEKPFAVMVLDRAFAARVAVVDAVGGEALESPARPIVLLRRREGALCDGVAPGLAEVGIFLPPTPLQHLVARAFAAAGALVMTSGNLAGGPICFDDDEAIRSFAGIADGILLHDRPIHAPCDDSVVRPLAGRTVPLRRARGFVPAPVALPVAAGPLLAAGAGGKNTVCFAARGSAWMSPHLGDLSDVGNYERFVAGIARVRALLGIEPAVVAHDLHPDFASTRWAVGSGLPCVAVQHHHAHVAACLAENGRSEVAIGVAFDGTGLGDDGTLWGGEFLLADLRGYRRVGHLRQLPLPGGERAIRQPWRMALAALFDAGVSVDPQAVGRAAVVELLEKGLAMPLSSGAGRWFDAVAALCGVCELSSWDGQAAVLLEALAAPGPCEGYEFDCTGSPWVIDLRPAIRTIARDVREGVARGVVAGRFHETMAQVVLAGCEAARRGGGPSLVALSGGCFANRLLLERSIALLEGAGFEVLRHRLVPPNDGGISYGQAAVASASLRGGS